MRQHSFIVATSNDRVDFKKLPISAKDDTYIDLAVPYLRRAVARWARQLLASRIPGVFGFVVLIIGALWGSVGSQIRDIIERWIMQGPRPVDWQAFLSGVRASFLVRWVTANPLPSTLLGVSALAVVCLALWLGAWARADIRREHDVIRMLAAGLEFARLFRAYLTDVQISVGRLPPLLQAISQDALLPDGENITTIFTPLQLRESPLGALRGQPLDDQGEVGEFNGERDRSQYETRRTAPFVDDLYEAFAHSRNGAIALVSQPGAGKTTVLRHLAWVSAQRLLDGSKPEQVRIPVYLDLAGQEVRAQDIPIVIANRVKSARASSGAGEMATEFLTEIITTSHTLILLDGLDEVTSTTRNDTLRRISAFMDGRRRPPTATVGHGDRWDALVAVGTRIAGYIAGELPGCETWELLPLTQHAARQALVANALRIWESASRANHITTQPANLNPDLLLESLAASPVGAWAASPLLLTLSAIVWARRGGMGVVTSRGELYREAVDAILSLKTINWGTQNRMDLLHLSEEVALAIFLRGERAFQIEDFRQSIAHTLPAWLPNEFGPTGERKAGDALAVVSGLYFRVGEGEYNILHQTILEYLVASALARRLHAEWPQKPIDSDAFLHRLVTSDLIAKYHTPAVEAMRSCGTLGLIWTRRTPARWIETLRLMTGLLDTTDRSNEFSVARPDLAIAWVTALHRQPSIPAYLV